MTGRVPILGADSYTTDIQIDTSDLAREATAESARLAALQAAANAGDAEAAAELARLRALEIQSGIHGYKFRDLFSWNAISSDEDLAPLLAGNAFYSQFRGRPAYRFNTNTGSTQFTFAKLPRIYSASRDILTIEFDIVGITGRAETGIEILYGDTAGRRVAVQYDILNAGQYLTHDGTAQETTALAAQAANTWRHFEIRLEDTQVVFKREGSVEATHAIRYWPPAITDDPALNLIVRQEASLPGSGANLDYRFTNVNVFWSST